ncbi:hypothetical protein ACJMK2_031000 [Sinanodonta woodiana]|uniref:Uncharacterized protein n=1 Tax=Sinanodonta woodiana TaxID=1069815 RepID=A0ABD3WXG7_SINWO
MATSIANIHTEEKQNCPICLGEFSIPRQLPCMHSFCEKCLRDYLSSQAETLQKLDQIKCPICRQDVGISNQGKPTSSMELQFPINLILQSIIGDSKAKVKQPCDACHNAGIASQAHDLCMVCEETMCKTCSTVHRNQKFSRNHVIISVDEMLSNPQHVMKIAKGFSCPEHDGESIDFYCKDHTTACCSKCCIVSHRNCASVSDLENELPQLLQEINPESVTEKMKELENRLLTFTELNESNIGQLESTVKDLTSQIRNLRKQINDVLDKLETTIKMEGYRICKDEIIRKQDENHHCQGLINSIRNSYTLLETVTKYGTDTQMFLMTEKMTSQLTSYLEQIQQKYVKTETTKVLLKLDPQIRSILSAGPESLARIISRKELQSIHVPGIMNSHRNCLVQMEKTIEIKDNDDATPNYSGIVYLYSGHVMLTDYKNNILCLLNSDNSLTTYKLPCGPCEIFQFFTLTDGKITPTNKITTRYRYDGVAAAGTGKIVVSGEYAEGGKYYWSLISSAGKEEFYHQFDCHCDPSYTYVALDSSFTRVYIAVDMANSLYCFEMSGIQKFVYNHPCLDGPCGVATDSYDNVYVVGCGSNNIHQLSQDGVVLQIISDEVPESPMAICIRRDNNKILVTNDSDKTKLYQYRLR